jgi:small-conductance mechanosensitive channel
VPSSPTLQTFTDVLNWQLYNNLLREWLIAIATAGAVFALLLAIRRLAGRRLLSLALHTVGAHRNADDLGVALARRTRVWFLLLIGIGIGRLSLTLPPNAERLISDLLVIGALAQVAIWGNAVITYTVAHYSGRRRARDAADADSPEQSPRATVSALSVIARGIFWALLLLIALDNLGVHITTLIAGLGISGVAIALALQNILGDLFSALAIVLDKPFVVGDAIAVDSLGGTVERIGLKTTRVRGASGEEVIFSNADLLKSRVRNLQRMHERVVVLPLTVDGRTPPDRLTRIPTVVREIISAQPQVRFGRAHLTTITKGDVGVEAVYTITTADYGVFMDTQQAITLGLLDRLARERIRLV